jgi:hypothetical protein
MDLPQDCKDHDRRVVVVVVVVVVDSLPENAADAAG